MVEAELARKLRAILSADIEGSSRLIGEDEQTAIKLISTCRTVLENEVKRFGGNLFGEAGDGFMVEFDNAEDAVRCAVAIQKAIAEANTHLNSAPAWFRIGISLGDIVDDGRSKYGNAINVAARIQAISDPGGLCITLPVFEQVANKLAYAFDELGPTQLRNIPRPVNLMKVRWAEKPPSTPSRSILGATHPQFGKPSVAVLPFAFVGSPRGKSYLADSLVEEVTTELSRYRWLSVISKSSSFAYKGRKVDVRLIARELGARYLIEGSLRRDKRKLRINLHLVSGETGEDLWSERFNRPIQELFELKEDVVLGIAGSIEPKVKSAEIQRARKKPTESLTAYDYYLQALPYRGAISLADNQTALRLLEKAIDLDSRFAPALALASMCYATRKDQGWGPLDQEETRRALSLARSAVEADFDDPIALNLSAHTIASIGGDIAGAISLMDRSLKLSPSWSEAWARSSMVRIYAGDLETAQQHAENAIRLSPLDERIFLPLCALGYRYLFAERNREAIEAARRALVGRPRPPMAYIILLAASHGLGESSTFSSAVAALIQTAPNFRSGAWLAQSCFLKEDQRTILKTSLRAAQLPV